MVKDFLRKLDKTKILTGAAIAVGVVVLLFFYKCPIKLIFGFDCPGCGMTRAFLSACKFNFAEAFEYHPLFWLIGIEGIYWVITRLFVKKHFSEKTETACVIATAVLMIIVWIIRLILK